MKKLIAALLALASLAVQAEVWQARYGIAETFNFKLYNSDGTLDVDEADGGTEVSLSCNEGAETTATNDFVDEGTFYSIALTATELQCERVAVVIAATTTEVFFIQTIGNASAMIPTYESNVASVTTGAIENGDFATTPGANGGLLIAGTNADFDVTGNAAFAGGITVTQSSSNTAGLAITGNGTGAGVSITSGSGATGTGLAITSAATNGAGMTVQGTGTGNGATFASGTGATGAGVAMSSGATNGPGLALQGAGASSGLLATGGATGHGISGIGGSTSGNGIRATGTAGNSAAMNLVGQGSAAGLLSTGGATGHGFSLVGGSTSGNAIATSTTAPTVGAPELGYGASGTASGTHSTTTIDLGTNAPSSAVDVVGKSLVVDGKFSRLVTAYDDSTGVATFSTVLTAPANGDVWRLWDSAPGEGGGGLDAAGVRAAIGLASANLDTQLGAIDDYVDTEVAAILVDTGTTLDDLVDDLESRLGTPSNLGGGATVAANLSDIEGQTDDIGAAGAGLTAIDLPNQTMDISGTITTATNVTTVNGLGANVITAAATAADFTTEVTSGLATAAAVSAVDDFVDTEVAAIQAVTDKLDDTLELDSTVYRFTINALEQAPSGGGGVADWNADERTAIRSILGVPASGTTPDTPTVGMLATIEGQTDDIGAAGAGLTAADDAVMTRLGAPAGASVSADVAAVKSDTAAVLVDTGTTLDDLIEAIKATTDQFIFTVTGEVDANVESMNEAEVLGTGTSIDKWRGE